MYLGVQPHRRPGPGKYRSAPRRSGHGGQRRRVTVQRGSQRHFRLKNPRPPRAGPHRVWQRGFLTTQPPPDARARVSDRPPIPPPGRLRRPGSFRFQGLRLITTTHLGPRGDRRRHGRSRLRRCMEAFRTAGTHATGSKHLGPAVMNARRLRGQPQEHPDHRETAAGHRCYWTAQNHKIRPVDTSVPKPNRSSYLPRPRGNPAPEV